MTKILNNTRVRSSENAIRVIRTATICNCSERWVRKVIRGDVNDEDVMNVYMGLQEGENNLLETVRQLVPIIK